MRKDLSHVRVSDTTIIAKHNETDYESFKKVKESIDRGVDRVNKKAEVDRRKESLIEWVNSVPKRWSQVSINTLDEKNSQRIKSIIKHKGACSVFICQEPTTEMMDMTYALGRRFVSGGKARFENFAFVNEESLSALSRSGFEGKKQVDALFSKSKKVYILNGVTKDYYVPQELSLMKRLVEHVYSNDLLLIVSSSVPFEDFCENVKGAKDLLVDMFKDAVIVGDQNEKKDSNALSMFDNS